MMGTQCNHHHLSITLVQLLLLVVGLFLSCDAFSYPPPSRRARLLSSSASQRIASLNLGSTATNFTESASSSNIIWLKEGDDDIDDAILPLIAMPHSTSDKSVMVASLFGALALVCCIKISNVFTLSTIFQSFVADPVGTISSIGGGTSSLSSMIYFGLFYVIAELIAIPATPLTLSAGYLFGVTNGTILVLLSGVISAVVGFSIGRLFLREKVEGVLDDKPIFRKLDKITSSDGGLKMLILARLSPLFPFCLLNYFYGVSSMSFLTFVLGTTLGFVPTTLLYTYTGLVGKEVVLGSGGQPWLSVCATITLLGGLKLVTDIVTNLIGAVEEE